MRARIDTEGWARHAGAANGFGDAFTPGHAWDPRLNRAAHHAARAHAANGVGDVMAAALRGVLAWLRAVDERRRQRREAREVYDALRGLDDRTLHDLGFSRSELTSVASEASGQATPTRAHMLHTTYGLPG